MTKTLRCMVVGALVAAAAFGSYGVARADINDASATNMQSGNNRSTGSQGGSAKSGDSVGGQVSGVVSSGRTSVDARNNSTDSSVSSGDARGSNSAGTFTGLNDSSTSTVAPSDITDAAASNLQDGDNRSTNTQASNATTGDGVAGEVIGVVTAGGGSASVVAANTTRDTDVSTGDANSSNDLGAFVGLNDSDLLSVSDITDAAATNLQDGNNRLTGRQSSTAATGDGVGGQVLGVVSAGATSLDASNTTDNSSVDTGDSDSSNGAGYFVGLNDSSTSTVAPSDITDAAASNLQDGNNTRTFTQTANATSGDSVAGQVSGVVTSAGGSASVVLANNSTNIDSASGESRFDNADAGFVGLNDSGPLTIPG